MAKLEDHVGFNAAGIRIKVQQTDLEKLLTNEAVLEHFAGAVAKISPELIESDPVGVGQFINTRAQMLYDPEDSAGLYSPAEVSAIEKFKKAVKKKARKRAFPGSALAFDDNPVSNILNVLGDVGPERGLRFDAAANAARQDDLLAEAGMYNIPDAPSPMVLKLFTAKAVEQRYPAMGSNISVEELIGILNQLDDRSPWRAPRAGQRIRCLVLGHRPLAVLQVICPTC